MYLTYNCSQKFIYKLYYTSGYQALVLIGQRYSNPIPILYQLYTKSMVTPKYLRGTADAHQWFLPYPPLRRQSHRPPPRRMASNGSRQRLRQY